MGSFTSRSLRKMKEIKVKPKDDNFWAKIKIGDTIGDDFLENKVKEIVFCHFIPYRGYEQPVELNKANCVRFGLDDGSNHFWWFNPENEDQKNENNLLKTCWKGKINESVNLSKILKEIEFSQYQIYCDMDEVLTDFKSRYEHFTGMLPDEMEAELTKQYGKEKAKAMFWEKVDHLGTKFWTGIPWMKDGHMLWNYIKKYNPILLSSPSRSQTSVEGKKLWVDKYLPGTELILRQANKKQEFAGPKNILIDDRADNIQQWIAKGGIGILHKSASDTIHQLKELGFDNINEIKVIKK
jgi:hypothetical protein